MSYTVHTACRYKIADDQETFLWGRNIDKMGNKTIPTVILFVFMYVHMHVHISYKRYVAGLWTRDHT